MMALAIPNYSEVSHTALINRKDARNSTLRLKPSPQTDVCRSLVNLPWGRGSPMIAHYRTSEATAFPVSMWKTVKSPVVTLNVAGRLSCFLETRRVLSTTGISSASTLRNLAPRKFSPSFSKNKKNARVRVYFGNKLGAFLGVLAMPYPQECKP